MTGLLCADSSCQAGDTDFVYQLLALGVKTLSDLVGAIESEQTQPGLPTCAKGLDALDEATVVSMFQHLVVGGPTSRTVRYLSASIVARRAARCSATASTTVTAQLVRHVFLTPPVASAGIMCPHSVFRCLKLVAAAECVSMAGATRLIQSVVAALEEARTNDSPLAPLSLWGVALLAHLVRIRAEAEKGMALHGLSAEINSNVLAGDAVRVSLAVLLRLAKAAGSSIDLIRCGFACLVELSRGCSAPTLHDVMVESGQLMQLLRVAAASSHRQVIESSVEFAHSLASMSPRIAQVLALNSHALLAEAQSVHSRLQALQILQVVIPCVGPRSDVDKSALSVGPEAAATLLHALDACPLLSDDDATMWRLAAGSLVRFSSVRVLSAVPDAAAVVRRVLSAVLQRDDWMALSFFCELANFIEFLLPVDNDSSGNDATTDDVVLAPTVLDVLVIGLRQQLTNSDASKLSFLSAALHRTRLCLEAAPSRQQGVDSITVVCLLNYVGRRMCTHAACSLASPLNPGQPLARCGVVFAATSPPYGSSWWCRL